MDFQTLQAEHGGRPLANDDLLVLQNQSLNFGLAALLQPLRGCVVSGCRVYQTGSVWNVGAGLVWTGYTLLPFPGQSNVSLPLVLVDGPIEVVDERAYQTGGTKTTIKSQAAVLVPYDSNADGVYLDENGGVTIWQMLANQTREVGTVEYVQSLNGYDGTGRGYGAKAGWALCNGNNGTLRLGGQFVVGYDYRQGDYATVGGQGGSAKVTLGVNEMPSHTHGLGTVLTYVQGRNGVDLEPNGSYGWNSQLESSAGNGNPHENRPPYTVLVARQWLGLG